MQPSIAPSTPIPRQETVELVYRIFGDVLVPLEQVRERWFRNLNKENFSKALACGRIALPVTTSTIATRPCSSWPSITSPPTSTSARTKPEAPVEHSRALTASHPERPAVASIVGSDTMLRLADIAW